MNSYPFMTGTVNNPIIQNLPQVQPNILDPHIEIYRVNGEEGAKAFRLAPNSSVILMDTNNPLIWVVVTDGAGYKTVTPFTISPYEPPKPITTNDLSAVITRLEQLEERMNSYGQPDSKLTQSNNELRTDNANTQSSK